MFFVDTCVSTKEKWFSQNLYLTAKKDRTLKTKVVFKKYSVLKLYKRNLKNAKYSKKIAI